MELIYAAKRGRKDQDVLQLSWELRIELTLLLFLSLLAATNMRASSAPWVDQVDASDWGIAHVRAPVLDMVAIVLYRHT
eukprot:889460-Heterocapsa_arctica.AAC.1